MRKKELATLTARLRAHDDLERRLMLLESIPGIGAITALTLVVRMPELGQMSRQQAAAMAGLAPFNCDSGAHAGLRRVERTQATAQSPLHGRLLCRQSLEPHPRGFA